MSERVTITIAGPSYRNEYDAPPTTDGRSVEWRAFVRQLRTAIDHARQLEAFSDLAARRQLSAATTPQYTVVVGNVGTVYSGSDQARAREVYAAYLADSQRQYGTVAGEPVTLFCDEEIDQEYPGTLAADGDDDGGAR